jgi:DNA-binding transcriptional ArsR family regulator
MKGDVNIAGLAALLAEPARARIVSTLADGRALPASMLASEAHIAASTASEHLARLTTGGLLLAERHGRHRYYRLAGPEVAQLLEAMASIAPALPVRSLKDSTRASALRAARTCYDHLAGSLGTTFMRALLDQRLLEGGDGSYVPERARHDRLAAPGRDLDYRLTPAGEARLRDFGVDVAELRGRRRLIRYCVDWSEQRHHLAGQLGAAVLARMLELGWLRRAPTPRALLLTDAGRAGLAETFEIVVPDAGQDPRYG